MVDIPAIQWLGISSVFEEPRRQQPETFRLKRDTPVVVNLNTVEKSRAIYDRLNGTPTCSVALFVR